MINLVMSVKLCKNQRSLGSKFKLKISSKVMEENEEDRILCREPNTSFKEATAILVHQFRKKNYFYLRVY